MPLTAVWLNYHVEKIGFHAFTSNFNRDFVIFAQAINLNTFCPISG